MDDTHFVAVISPYVGAMLRAATALIGPADAEDATQEALLRAWKAASTLQEGSTVRAWLLRITVNVCRDWRRGRFGTRERLTAPARGDGDVEYLPLATLETDPSTNSHALALDLRQLVNELEDDLRIVIVLRYYATMNATEIGTALGVPASTVRTRLSRALAQLRLASERTEINTQGRAAHE